MAVPAGIVTVVVPALLAPGPSGPTSRLPSRASEPSNTPFTDRYTRVTLAGAAAPPTFFVVSLTLIAAPAPAVGGAVAAATVRSGPTHMKTGAVLFASCVSGTT